MHNRAQSVHRQTRYGTQIIKFFLHLSKEEQRKRFLDRLDELDKKQMRLAQYREVYYEAVWVERGVQE